jgi:DNA mismatch endonuclease (patch repair protein)
VGRRQPEGSPATLHEMSGAVRRLDRRFFGGAYPLPSSAAATTIMKANRSRDTSPEILLRSALHRAGMRFRVHQGVRVDDGRPIVVDVAFTRRKVAVFMDGCFWHACPKHGTTPRANSSYWRPKLARNSERDLETVARLERAGWCAIRIWEHEDVAAATARVAAAVHAATRVTDGPFCRPAGGASLSPAT